MTDVQGEAARDQPLPAGGGCGPLPEESRRQIVIDVLATAVAEMLLAEIDSALRDDDGQLSTR